MIPFYLRRCSRVMRGPVAVAAQAHEIGRVKHGPALRHRHPMVNLGCGPRAAGRQAAVVVAFQHGRAKPPPRARRGALMMATHLPWLRRCCVSTRTSCFTPSMFFVMPA